MRSTWRLFVAAYPPAEWSASALGLLGGLPLAGLRPTPAPQVHLTLHFLGEVDQSALGQVEESIRNACGGITPFFIEPRALRSLPARGVVRALVIETSAPPSLLELHARLSHRFRRGRKSGGRDTYTPHLTLARFAPAKAPSTQVQFPVALGGFSVTCVSLVRSVLHPEGAEHRVLATVPLGA
ncbi:MAG: RNA 2',3'-cyclic phosphodiesterase [Phycisphaeraceae bacterium]|nr:RNA 2',3'-cyclic phosphodiesterase [Phycisphaeraceae bacterium]